MGCTSPRSRILLCSSRGPNVLRPTCHMLTPCGRADKQRDQRKRDAATRLQCNTVKYCRREVPPVLAHDQTLALTRETAASGRRIDTLAVPSSIISKAARSDWHIEHRGLLDPFSVIYKPPPAIPRDIQVSRLRSRHTVTSVREASRERNAEASRLGRGRRRLGGGAAREYIDDDRALRGDS